jgi:4,5-dihydroxyphthalate decarboxylase
MSRTALSTMIGDYPFTLPLKRGEVRSDILDLQFADVKTPNRAFKGIVRNGDYQVAELAIMTFLQAKAWGKPLVLLPAVVGPGRFQHPCLVYNSERGAMTPADLAGKRIGARAYAQTTVTWVRGILAGQYGVDLSSLRWTCFEEGHMAEYRDPPSVERADGRDMIEMLLAGEIDAAIIGNERPSDPRIRTLIADPVADAMAWTREHGAVPINHMITMRESVVRERPDLAAEVFRMVRESRRVAEAAKPPAGGPDMLPLGLAANRNSLELAIEFAWSQGLLPRRLTVDELFDDATRDLV